MNEVGTKCLWSYLLYTVLKVLSIHFFSLSAAFVSLLLHSIVKHLFRILFYNRKQRKKIEQNAH